MIPPGVQAEGGVMCGTSQKKKAVPPLSCKLAHFNYVVRQTIVCIVCACVLCLCTRECGREGGRGSSPTLAVILEG